MRRRRVPASGWLWLVVFLGAAGRASGADAETDYLAVQRAFLREEFKRVAELAGRFQSAYPEAAQLARVRIWRALSLDRLGRPAEALEAFAQLRTVLPDEDAHGAEVLFWEAEVSRRSGRAIQAKQAYQLLLAHHPDSSWAGQAQVGLGLVYLQQQAFALAAKQFHEVTVHRGETSMGLQAALFEGLCYLRLKRFNRAADILQPLPDRLAEPDLAAQAAFYLGESLTGHGRYAQAAEAYHRAIEFPDAIPWSRLSLFGLGWAHYRANRCGESVAAFERYLAERMPDHRTEALFAHASCLLELGREGDATAQFEELLTRDPDHPLAIESALRVADVYRRQERFSLAKRRLHELLRRPLRDDDRGQVQVRLGAVVLDQGNAAQARTVFQLARHARDPAVRQAAGSGLADVELFVGNLEAAAALYSRAMRSSADPPVAVYATYQLGRLRLREGKVNEAIALFHRVIASAQPGLTGDARLGLAVALMAKDEAALARVELETMRRKHPSSEVAARAGYYLALLAVGQEDYPYAERLCQETMAQAPRTEEAGDARLLLADLLARRLSDAAAAKWLRRAYHTESMPRRHRGQVAVRLADYARMNGAYVSAIQWYELAATLWPALESESTYRIGSCYEEAGDLERAIGWYQQSPQGPWRVRGLLAAAKLLERQERVPAARAIYEALAEEPVPEAKIAQERLTALRARRSDEG